MGLAAYWDLFASWAMHAGMPLVHCYHLLCGNAFLNVAADDAQGLEKTANVVLTPVQYLLAGNEAIPVYDQEGTMSYHLHQRFNYKDEHLWHKTAVAYVALPSCLAVGSVLKGIAYLFPETRQRHEKILSSMASEKVRSNAEYYRSIGISIETLDEMAKIDPPSHVRRPGDEKTLALEKEALHDIVDILKKNNILFWMDCGSCLGTYRYGGIIPWDWDIDLAVLQMDFDNIKHALQGLNQEKYVVQDWSSRDKPQTYLKVYVKATGTLIDFYHFGIDEKSRTVYSILSNEGSVFLPEYWKIRERRFTIPTSFDVVFPLKKAQFDGIEVFVPNQTKLYLQQRYGENIEPAKIFDSSTGKYEKDMTHPYWQRAHVQ